MVLTGTGFFPPSMNSDNPSRSMELPGDCWQSLPLSPLYYSLLSTPLASHSNKRSYLKNPRLFGRPLSTRINLRPTPVHPFLFFCFPLTPFLFLLLKTLSFVTPDCQPSPYLEFVASRPLAVCYFPGASLPQISSYLTYSPMGLSYMVLTW